MEVSAVIKRKKEKEEKDFIPNYPNNTEFGVKKQALALGEKGNIIKEAEGNEILTTVFIVTDPNKRDRKWD